MSRGLDGPTSAMASASSSSSSASSSGSSESSSESEVTTALSCCSSSSDMEFDLSDPIQVERGCLSFLLSFLSRKVRI